MARHLGTGQTRRAWREWSIKRSSAPGMQVDCKPARRLRRRSESMANCVVDARRLHVCRGNCVPTLKGATALPRGVGRKGGGRGRSGGSSRRPPRRPRATSSRSCVRNCTGHGESRERCIRKTATRAANAASIEDRRGGKVWQCAFCVLR